MKILNLKNISGIKTIAAALAIMMVAPGVKAVQPSYYVIASNQFLMSAVRANSMEDVEFAIKNGPTDSVGRAHALCVAVDNHYDDIAKYLAQWCKDHHDCIDKILSIATEHGIDTEAVVSILLLPEAGIDPLAIWVKP